MLAAPENENATRDHTYNMYGYPSHEDSEVTYDSGSGQVTSLQDLDRLGPRPKPAGGYSTTMNRNLPSKNQKSKFAILSMQELGDPQETGFTAALKTPGTVGQQKIRFDMSN